MELQSALALIAATAVLVSIPGPNVALFVANTLAHGAWHGAMTVLGTTLGVGLQLGVVVLGFALVLDYAAWALGGLKWAGVAYLIWLGIVSWRAGLADVEEKTTSSAPLWRLFWQGMLLAMVNPKTMLFAAAFLPQFVTTNANSSYALLIPAAIYLSVVLLGDMLWVLSAQVARPAVVRLGRLRHRLTGCLFIGSGVGMALARIKE